MIDIEQQLREAALDLPADGPPVAERAAEEGLLDVAYASVDSPLGPLVVAATPKGLVRVSYRVPRRGRGARGAGAPGLPARARGARRLDGVRRELDEYFEGTPRAASTPRSTGRTWPASPARCCAPPRAIPFGEVSTYAGVAEAAGSPRAVRAAGNALGANPMPVVVPCHRVLRTGGALGGYTGGVERKEFLLRLEGMLL